MRQHPHVCHSNRHNRHRGTTKNLSLLTLLSVHSSRQEAVMKQSGMFGLSALSTGMNQKATCIGGDMTLLVPHFLARI
jgi:hypothetical protein